MIDWVSRYKTELNDVFSEEKKHELMLQIEAALAKALAEHNIIPQEAAEEISNACKPETVLIHRVKAIEEEISHDIMALVKAIAEKCPKYGGFVHFGATSQDINDSLLGLQLSQAKRILNQAINDVRADLTTLSLKYKDLTAIGRTHGQHAVPITMGFKFANFLYELWLAQDRFKRVQVNLGKLSGATGTYAALGTQKVEKTFLRKLGLTTPPIKTQVITRVFLAEYVTSLAIIVSVLERIANEIRNLQRTEIAEIFEPFGKKQVGSSTMPQKRNPHKSERVVGIAKVIKSQVNAALQNIPLEHERDLTNSSLERIIIPTVSILTHYILKQTHFILSNLTINETNVLRNLNLTKGRQLAERIMIALSNEIGRQKAHEILRTLAEAENFDLAVRTHPEIASALSQDKLDHLLRPETYVGLAPMLAEKIAQEYGVFPDKPLYAPEEDLTPLLKAVEATAKESVLNTEAFARGVEANGIIIGGTTDGVGTKLFVAQLADIHSTIGIDCVAMNVNDLVASGFEPIAFVDYIAITEIDQRILEEIAKGLMVGCKIAEIPLLGGETAVVPEMIRGPGSIPYDLSGTAIGKATKEDLVDGSNIKTGDVIIGLPSNGLHSNGYTLARKILFRKYDLNDMLPWGISLKDELLKPTKIYLKAWRSLKQAKIPVRGMVHVTGGGVLKLKRLGKRKYILSSWPEIPPIFKEIQKIGELSDEIMFSTFNMGIGFMFIVPPEFVEETVNALATSGDHPFVLGRIGEKPEEIVLEFSGVSF